MTLRSIYLTLLWIRLWVKKLDDKIVPDSCKFVQKTNNLIVTIKKGREINWDDFEWKPKNNVSFEPVVVF